MSKLAGRVDNTNQTRPLYDELSQALMRVDRTNSNERKPLVAVYPTSVV